MVTLDSPTAGTPTDGRTWGDSPWLSFAIRSAVFLVPIGLSFWTTWFLANRWEPPSTVPAALVRFAVLAAVAVAVGVAADKGARRFLPLAALFRLSLVFPDQAPSRFAVALRSGNTRRIEQRLAEVESGGFRGDEADAALLIVEFAAALSEHDRLTRGHSERVRAYTALIAEEMGLSDEDSNKLQWAGLIHDVGKLRIAQEILTKPSALTAEEFEVIKTHPAEGMRLAAPLAGYLGPWMGAIGEHHERFDGGGYPNGLAGTDISIAGRIVAVADAYDVITAARSYKKPLATAFAREELANNAGSQFDPVVVRAFLGISLGRLRRAMWPLSWMVQVPFLGAAITTPVAQTVAATVVTLAAATGVTAATDGFEAFGTAPDAIAMVETEDEIDADPGDVAAGPAATPSTVPNVQPQTNEQPPREPENTGQSVVVDQPDSEAPTATSETPTSTDASTTTVGPDAPQSSDPQPTTGPTTTTTTSTTTTTTTIPLTDCQRAQQGNGSHANSDLRNCDLSALTFTSGEFNGADFSGAVFDDTTIVGGNFTNAIFDDAEFINADIRNATFTNASFVRTSISDSGIAGANLAGANFSNATITDVGISSNLTNVNLDGARITSAGFAESTMTGVSMRNAIVAQSSFNNLAAALYDGTGSTFFEVTFENSTLNEARFAGSEMSFTVFTGATLTGATFANAQIVDVNFYDVRATNADFSNATMRKINLNDAVGTGANFSGAELNDGAMVSATMNQVTFRDATFIAWDLNGANLRSSDFTGASFTTSSMQSANASNATFTSANFGDGGLWMFNANLMQANFQGAVGTPSQPETGNYNQTTCPDGSVSSSPCW